MKQKFILFAVTFVMLHQLPAHTFGTPIPVVNPIFGTGVSMGKNSFLPVVNINPAISYYDATHGNREYVRANDAAGISWGTFVTTNAPGEVKGLPYFVFSTAYTALSFNIIAFRAIQSKNNNRITWLTENEINTSNYIIEKSSNGNTFTKVGTVLAYGNKGGFYTFDDKQPGVYYYRLQIVDKDGKTAYSETIKMNTHSTGNINIYPNPVVDNLTIQINNAQLVGTKATITDSRGNIQRTIILRWAVQTVNMNGLRRDIYFFNTNTECISIIKT